MNFESSQDGKEKGFVTFAERALKRFGAMQSGPGPEFRAGRTLAGRNPARRVVGGESGGAREVKRLMVHLYVASGR